MSEIFLLRSPKALQDKASAALLKSSTTPDPHAAAGNAEEPPQPASPDTGSGLRARLQPLGSNGLGAPTLTFEGGLRTVARGQLQVPGHFRDAHFPRGPGRFGDPRRRHRSEKLSAWLPGSAVHGAAVAAAYWARRELNGPMGFEGAGPGSSCRGGAG